MDIEMLKVIGSLGVGAVLAVIIFMMYRRDRRTSEEQLKQYAEQLRQDRVFMEDRMNGIISRDQESREAGTRATVELTNWLQRQNGRR